MKWSQEELDIVINNRGLPAKEIQALLPKRSLHSIYGKRRQLGVTESSKINSEQTEYIQNNYNNLSTQELADYCNVHRTTVERHMKSLGLIPIRKLDDWTMVDYSTSYEDGEFAIEYTYEKRYD